MRGRSGREKILRVAFIQKQHSVAVYDTTWKQGIMKELHQIGFRVCLPIFVCNFLSNRRFQVCINTTLSSVHQQELGVPRAQFSRSLSLPSNQ